MKKKKKKQSPSFNEDVKPENEIDFGNGNVEDFIFKDENNQDNLENSDVKDTKVNHENKEPANSLNEVILVEPKKQDTVEAAEELQVTNIDINSDNEKETTNNLDEVINDNFEIEQIKQELEKLNNKFETKLKYDSHKQEIIDKLHKELQQYKDDLYKKILLPVVNEIVFLVDDYKNLFKSYKKVQLTEIDTEKLLKQFGGIGEDMEEVLFKNGIEPFVNEGENFNPSKQKILKIVSTDDPEKDKTICERVRTGYIWENKLFRKEMVNCYKYQQIKNENHG